MTVLVRDVEITKSLAAPWTTRPDKPSTTLPRCSGSSYPGGPEIEKTARGGDHQRFDLPRSMLDSKISALDFKTAVRYLLPKIVIPGRVDGEYLVLPRSGWRGSH
jgi:hypothetical protein